MSTKFLQYGGGRRLVSPIAQVTDLANLLRVSQDLGRSPTPRDPLLGKPKEVWRRLLGREEPTPTRLGCWGMT